MHRSGRYGWRGSIDKSSLPESSWSFLTTSMGTSLPEKYLMRAKRSWCDDLSEMSDLDGEDTLSGVSSICISSHYTGIMLSLIILVWLLKSQHHFITELWPLCMIILWLRKL